MILDPIKAAVAPYMLAIKVGLVLLVFALGWNRGADKWQGKFDGEVAAHKATKAQHKAVIDDLAAKTRAVADKAKAASKQAALDRRAADTRYKEATDEANRAKRDLRNHLRAGTVRLRDEFTCPAARPAEGGASAAAGRQDAAPDFRREREAAISDDIAEADAADNWIGWLQSELISTRMACGASP